LKLINRFSDFLRDTVNLNSARLDALESSVEALESFVRDSDWKPRVWKFEPQGSWATRTIIKPVDGNEFDADLLVIINSVDGWSARQYVDTLFNLFDSSGRYGDKVERHDYCVRIIYSGMRRVDITPCVRGRLNEGEHEVCNRRSDSFDRSEPTAFTEWLRERNLWSGGDNFRKVTRLVKYLRDITKRFECPSVLLTTLLGSQVAWHDKGSEDFADVPSALRAIFGRLDDWMQLRPVKPQIPNPTLPHENFGAMITDAAYERLRDVVHTLRQAIDVAYATEGFHESIEAWRKVFGAEFAKGASVLAKADLLVEISSVQRLLSSTAHHDDSLVDRIVQLGRWIWSPGYDRPPHMQKPMWKRATNVSTDVQVLATWQEGRHSPSGIPVQDFDELSPKGGLWFDVRVNGGQPLPPGYRVRWRITNTGAIALAMGKGRGGFEHPQEGHRRWEELSYRGVHLSEAFIIRERDGLIVGQSDPFHVMIR
jgi:hypothetical protein